MNEKEKNIISEAINDMEWNEFKACLNSFRKSAEAYIAGACLAPLLPVGGESRIILDS